MLADTSLDSVPAEFVKYFFIVASFVVANYLMLKRAGGRRDDPLHLQQPIETRRTVVYAEKKDVETKLNFFDLRLAKIEADLITRFDLLISKGHERETNITNAIHAGKEDIMKQIGEAQKQTYSRINSQDQRLSNLEGRLKLPTPHSKE